jgi:hypothetical protein
MDENSISQLLIFARFVIEKVRWNTFICCSLNFASRCLMTLMPEYFESFDPFLSQLVIL